MIGVNAWFELLLGRRWSKELSSEVKIGAINYLSWSALYIVLEDTVIVKEN